MLLEEIAGVHPYKYDFYYLPMDHRSNCNVGYAFLNFVHPLLALRFFVDFNERKWGKFKSEKICKVQFSRMQGKQEFVEHFRNKDIVKKKKHENHSPTVLETPIISSAEILSLRQFLSN